MIWVYLSPHLDDVALSVGGLVWEQSQSGQDVHIWTICAGDPPFEDLSPFAQSVHTRWGIGPDAAAGRRQEDLVSCDLLGASYVHFDFPDCIYRRSDNSGEYLYASEEALWYPIHPDEEGLVLQIGDLLKQRLMPLMPDVRLVSPLTLGEHVDHRLTRAAAEKVGLPLYFYADFPYILRNDLDKRAEYLRSKFYTISPGGMLAWQNAVAAHHSQISTFWDNLEEMRSEIQSYYHQMGGIWLGESDFERGQR